MTQPRRFIFTTFVAISLSGGVLAHSGVKNPAVMARMHAMKSIGDEMKVLGEMAKGKAPFDQVAARAAAAAIAKHAAETPALFEAEEDDPKSEARPEIWSNFADFTEKSDALATLATELSANLNTRDDLQDSVKAMAQACQACHKPYRE